MKGDTLPDIDWIESELEKSDEQILALLSLIERNNPDQELLEKAITITNYLSQINDSVRVGLEDIRTHLDSGY